MCSINKRQGLRTRGRSWWGGGGRGRYEAQRVKGGFHVITCNLTASASHLLVSAVPRIWITVSQKSLFNRVGKYMYCHTISPGSYISWHKGAAHPLPPTVFSLHPPPPPTSHPCVLYCALLACGRIFLVFSIPFSFLFHKEVVVFWRQCSKFNLQGDFFTFSCEITLSSF